MDQGRGVKRAAKNDLLLASRKRIYPDDPTEIKLVESLGSKPHNKYKGGSFVDIEFSTGDFCVQALDECICLSYHLEELSGDTWASVNVPTDNNNTDFHFGISPILGANTFISSFDVTVNNSTVARDTGVHYQLYQAVTRRMCGKRMQRELGIYKIHNNMKELREDKKYFGQQFQTLAGSRVVSGFLEHSAFFGPNKCLTAETLIHQKGSPGVSPDVIPPGVNIRLRLKLVDDLWTRLVAYNITSPWFESEVAMDPQNKNAEEKKPWGQLQFNEDKYRVVIDDIKLHVTKASFNRSSELYKSLSSGSLSLYKDNIRTTIQSLPAGIQGYATNHAISPFTPVVLVVFTINRQLYFDKVGARPSDVTHFVLPKKILSVSFNIDDGVSSFKDGLKLNFDNPSRSKANHLYYLYLKSRGFVDESFEEWSVAATGAESTNNCYLLDLSPFKPRTTSANVTISIQFDGVSPAGFNVTCLSPSESNYGHDKNGIWYSDASIL